MASKTPRETRPGSQRNKTKKDFEPCEICSKADGETSHCVHCGKIICHKHRQEHVKEVIDKLKKAKSEANKLIIEARGKQGRIFHQEQATELQRLKLNDHVEVDFKYLQQNLDQREAELLVDLRNFGFTEIQKLHDQQAKIESGLADLRKAEMDFTSRLANYTMMDNSDLNYLCQSKVNYMNCLRWIDQLSQKQRAIPPIEFKADTEELRDEIKRHGDIKFKGQ